MRMIIQLLKKLNKFMSKWLILLSLVTNMTCTAIYEYDYMGCFFFFPVQLIRKYIPFMAQCMADLKWSRRIFIYVQIVVTFFFLSLGHQDNLFLYKNLLNKVGGKSRLRSNMPLHAAHCVLMAGWLSSDEFPV